MIPFSLHVGNSPATLQSPWLQAGEILPNPNQHPSQKTLGHLQTKLPLMGNLKAGTELCATDRQQQQQSPSKANYQINLVLLLKKDSWSLSPHFQNMSTPRGVKDYPITDIRNSVETSALVGYLWGRSDLLASVSLTALMGQWERCCLCNLLNWALIPSSIRGPIGVVFVKVCTMLCFLCNWGAIIHQAQQHLLIAGQFCVLNRLSSASRMCFVGVIKSTGSLFWVTLTGREEQCGDGTRLKHKLVEKPNEWQIPNISHFIWMLLHQLFDL